MKRKMENLTHRHQSISALHPTRTFYFTEQVTKANKEELPVIVPDNWAAPETTGGYFASRSVQRANGGLGESISPTQSKSKRHHTQSPAERQSHLDQLIHDRVVNALAAQRASEDARLDACKAQRELEIVKYHQRMKARTELQIKSNQMILGHSVGEMDLDQLLHDTQCSGATTAAAQREEHRGDAQRQHIEFNRDRLEHNLLHRQYLLESHKERERFRQGLEAHVGTMYSKQKAELMHDVGVSGPGATFVSKPLYELQTEKTMYLTTKRNEKHADEELEALAREVTDMDEKLWKESRSRKGQPSVRTREIVYSVDAALPPRRTE